MDVQPGHLVLQLNRNRRGYDTSQVTVLGPCVKCPQQQIYWS